MGLKKTVLKLRSIKSMVIAPAKTGNERRRRKAVIKTDQTNKGNVYMRIPRARMFTIVTIKLIAPRIEDNPAK
jgi:hypothetical protein